MSTATRLRQLAVVIVLGVGLAFTPATLRAWADCGTGGGGGTHGGGFNGGVHGGTCPTDPSDPGIGGGSGDGEVDPHPQNEPGTYDLDPVTHYPYHNCEFVTLTPQPQAGDAGYIEHDPATQVIQRRVCATTSASSGFIDYQLADINQPPPFDPAAEARRVFFDTDLPTPTIAIGPNPSRIAVNVALQAAVTSPGIAPVHIETPAGQTMDATFSIANTAFSFGDGGATNCGGDGGASCSYTYDLRSLPSRTGGSGKWTITATVTWAMTWTSNVAPGGTLTNTVTGQLQQYVGEYRTVVVPTR